MKIHTVAWLVVAAFAAPAAAAPKEKILYVSWGDDIGWKGIDGALKLDTPEKIPQAAKIWKSWGYDKILFRADDFRVVEFANVDIGVAEGLGGYTEYMKTWRRVTQEAAAADMLKIVVDACRANGLRTYAWITIFDEGTPPSVEYMTEAEARKSWPFYERAPTRFVWVTRFTTEHPEYLVVSRDRRKVQHGVMEYAYPDVRRYMRGVIGHYVDRHDFDGIFVSTRSHSIPAEFGDQFGFGEPVVAEFKRRHNVDILFDNFDVEKWRALRGEYLTQFLRELRGDLRAKGKRLALGVPQGDHMGPPFGNMVLEWRTWLRDKLVDELLVGHIAGRFVFPARPAGYGYVSSQEDRLGVPPFLEDLEKSYGPACARSGVRLWADQRRLGKLKPTEQEVAAARHVDAVLASSLEVSTQK